MTTELRLALHVSCDLVTCLKKLKSKSLGVIKSLKALPNRVVMFDKLEQSYCGSSASSLAKVRKTIELLCFVLSSLSAVALLNAGRRSKTTATVALDAQRDR